MKVLKLSAVIATALLSTAAMANTGTKVMDGARTVAKTALNPAAVSAEVGTLGYGANIAWAVNDSVELQAGWAGGDVAKMGNNNFDANGVNYKVDTKFSNPYAGVQMRPLNNWLTIGAGVIVPKNEIDIRTNGDNKGAFSVDGKKYKQEDVGALAGKLKHRNDLAPYLTFGVRPNINNNWGLFAEAGMAYLGKSDATIAIVDKDRYPEDATVSSVEADGVAPTQTSRKAIIEQATRDIEQKEWSNWYPIVKAGVTYRF